MDFEDLKNFLKDYFGLWSKNEFSQKGYQYKVLRKHLIILLIIYIINMFLIYLYNDPVPGFGLIIIYYAVVSPIRPYDEEESIENVTFVPSSPIASPAFMLIIPMANRKICQTEAA